MMSTFVLMLKHISEKNQEKQIFHIFILKNVLLVVKYTTLNILSVDHIF